MRILGIDPGTVSGWCVYDSTERIVRGSGTFPEWQLPPWAKSIASSEHVVIERPKGYGPTRPQVVECGYIAGRLHEILRRYVDVGMVTELTRLEVCKALAGEVHGVIRVRNDATAWAALLEMHGGAEAAKKGGPLAGVKSHGRAALAAAVARAVLGIPLYPAEGTR